MNMSDKKISEEDKKFQELGVKNKKGQAFIDQLIIQGTTKAPEVLKEEAEITRIAAEIMKDTNIQEKVTKLSTEISKKLNPAILLGDSPHKDTAAYYAENAHKYARDKNGNYILRKEYLVRAVAKQVSAELVAKSIEDKKQEAKTDNNEKGGR